MSQVITEQVFNIYSSDHADIHWYQIEDEQTVGGGSGIRISYRESDRKVSESDYIDIIGSPEMIRAIGLAIVSKASELLMRQNVSNFRGE